MRTYSFLTLAIVTCVAASASAGDQFYPQPPGTVVVPGSPSVNYGVPVGHFHNGVPLPVQPQFLGPHSPQVVPVIQRPSVPIYVTPNTYRGRNPYTGGIDTQNHQTNNTYYDYGRNGSQFNGTRRWVDRPVYGTNGQIIGRQTGYVWNNSFTGQQHGNLQSQTLNGLGGVHNQTQVMSANVTR